MDDPLDVIELRKSLADLAEAMRYYHQSLVEQGFSKREAMTMTVAYQRALLTPTPN